jgi:hypothetical protein
MIFTDTLVEVERTGITVDVQEVKETSDGYLGIATFWAYDRKIEVKIEVLLRKGKASPGVRATIKSDYLLAWKLSSCERKEEFGGGVGAPAEFQSEFPRRTS